MVQVGDIHTDISDFVVVHPSGIQCDRSILVSNIQVTNLDTVSCVRQSHVQRGCLVKGCGVAIEHCDVLLGGVKIRLVARQHLGPVAGHVHMGLVETGGIHVSDIDCDVVVQYWCAPS